MGSCMNSPVTVRLCLTWPWKVISKGQIPQSIDGINSYFQLEAVAKEGLLPWQHCHSPWLELSVPIQSQKVLILPVELSLK